MNNEKTIYNIGTNYNLPSLEEGIRPLRPHEPAWYPTPSYMSKSCKPNYPPHIAVDTSTEGALRHVQ
jgi:hypothetical protein